MNAEEAATSAFIEITPALAERVCYFWNNTRPCENQKWLLGCAFGLALHWDVICGYQIEELKFLSRLAGSKISEELRCMRHSYEVALTPGVAEG